MMDSTNNDMDHQFSLANITQVDGATTKYDHNQVRISYLENYIRSQKPDSVEFYAAYYDLFVLKKKILDTITFNNNLDSLIRTIPSKKKYFGSLKLY